MKTRHIMCAAAACCLLFLGYLGWQFVSDIEIGDVPDPSAGPFVYLETVTPPCESTAYSKIDPCERTDDVAPARLTLASRSSEGSPPTLEQILTRDDAPEYSSHVVLRGTLIPGSTRCVDYAYRPVAQIPADLVPALGRDDFRVLLCFTDVDVHEYLVGIGAPKMTVSTGGHTYWESEYPEEVQIRGMISFFRESVAEREEGREKVLFIGPSFTNASASWIAYNSWDVQRTDAGQIVAVAPHKEDWDQDPRFLSDIVIPLDEFASRIVEAHAAKISKTGGRASVAPDSPDLQMNAAELASWFIAVGAYSDGDTRPEYPPLFSSIDN